jgi:hypothetical protein
MNNAKKQAETRGMSEVASGRTAGCGEKEKKSVKK